MPILNDVPIHAGNLFTWHRNQFSGVIEQSTLSEGGKKIASKRVWDDASDVGFYIKSHTGRVVLFTLVRFNRNDEGEITSWTYQSHGFNTTLTITVFNT